MYWYAVVHFFDYQERKSFFYVSLFLYVCFRFGKREVYEIFNNLQKQILKNINYEITKIKNQIKKTAKLCNANNMKTIRRNIRILLRNSRKYHFRMQFSVHCFSCNLWTSSKKTQIFIFKICRRNVVFCVKIAKKYP